MPEDLPAADSIRIGELVETYEADLEVFRLFGDQLRGLVELPRLRKLYHSLRWRVKDPEHLKDKLLRRAAKLRTAGGEFDVTPDNLFSKINDLVGVRILHLHTSEFGAINEVLLELLAEQRYVVLEGPEARVWDDEYRATYDTMGVSTVKSERMYTSVHYVVEANTRTRRTAEIQVRTLAEELWGEVDHTINYPNPSPKLACREQIKVLARVTSSATRLVDAIFAVHSEQNEPPEAG